MISDFVGVSLIVIWDALLASCKYKRHDYVKVKRNPRNPRLLQSTFRAHRNMPRAWVMLSSKGIEREKKKKPIRARFYYIYWCIPSIALVIHYFNNISYNVYTTMLFNSEFLIGQKVLIHRDMYCRHSTQSNINNKKFLKRAQKCLPWRLSHIEKLPGRYKGTETGDSFFK